MADITVSLPDGSALSFTPGVSLTTVAEAIGPGLAKAALAAKVDGRFADLSARLDHDAQVVFLTFRDEEGRYVYRHSTAHIMAQAVQRLFPQAKVTIGPPLEDGRFYYDFDVERPFTPDDLAAIEREMQAVIAENQPFRREELSRDEARALFDGLGEPYKLELLDAIPDGEAVSVYWSGEKWVDLCRGVHLPSTGRVGAVKVLSSSGAYWRGDSNNRMLQRVYGTSFPDGKQLKEWLNLREEAEKRDHRKLGRELDLVWFDDHAPASPFFFPDGAFIYHKLVDLIRSRYRVFGYDEVITPQVLNSELWQTSGHMDNYRENMYFTELEEQVHVLKPMNCPAHCLMFGAKLHSYRELPIRYADFGRLHRFEPSGVTAGLTRVRTFCQDDAHIFCRHSQIQQEVDAFCEMLLQVYRLFGFKDIRIDLSTRPEKAVGSDEVWEHAERMLRRALDERGVAYHVAEGEGAFYGPKIDFMVSDALNRRHQLGTCQLDFNLPERFGLSYVTESDGREAPVMIHRALLGSLERFMGILIEHTGGLFPVWLAPVQAVVVPVGEKNLDYAASVARTLNDEGYRVRLDDGDERMQAKIALAESRKIPYMLVCGNREAESDAVAVRQRGMQDLGPMKLREFAARLAAEGRFPPQV